MDDMECNIRIEKVSNGYTVSVPDYAAMQARKDAAKKDKSGMASPYMGDCCKEFVAKDTKEVLALVKTALDTAPGGEFDAAWEEATAAARK